jgi:hypothetical protein
MGLYTITFAPRRNGSDAALERGRGPGLAASLAATAAALRSPLLEALRSE